MFDLLLFQYKYEEEYTYNPIKWLYWYIKWPSIYCTHCKKVLARDISLDKQKSCIVCAIKMKEDTTGITQRMPHIMIWGSKLKGIWY